MATIGIKKLIEINDVGYYAVSAQYHERYNFYISIDKQNRIIHFYENDNCSLPVQSIDYADDCKVIGKFPSLDSKIIARVGYLASKLFQQENFPDSEIWASCGS